MLYHGEKFSFVYRLKRGGANGCVETGVIQKLCPRNPSKPLAGLFKGITTLIGLKALIYNFYLAIGFRMVGGAHV